MIEKIVTVFGENLNNNSLRVGLIKASIHAHKKRGMLDLRFKAIETGIKLLHDKKKVACSGC